MQREMLRLRRSGATIGFVPTMGALHEGHLSLIRSARKENKIAAASIFVNPIQFGHGEDLKKYPRTLDEDKRLLKKAKVNYLFHPDAASMYPPGFAASVRPDARLVNCLCGKYRPGHFEGVATVVAKLFHIAQPHRAYFGAKDYQQAVIIRRMIRDLNMGIEFRLCPTVREKDGLAVSSRNRYLNPDERKRARAVPGVLFWLRDQIISGKRSLSRLKREAIKRLRAGVDRVQYLEIVDPENLASLKEYQSEMVAATACVVGKTRLIDNVIIKPLQNGNSGLLLRRGQVLSNDLSPTTRGH